jgi:hypothetical protein
VNVLAFAFSINMRGGMVELILWPIFVDAYHAISHFYVPMMDEKAAEYELPEAGGWLLLPALTFDPDTISAEKLRIRSPYTSARRYQAGLENVVARGFLIPEPGNDITYRLSPAGRQAILAIIQAGYGCMQTLHPLDTGELEALANMLYQLVYACLEAPEPPGKWSISHSRRIDPGDDAPVMVRIDQYLSDLAAYRDDCHLAAWQIHGIEGPAWEAFSVIWRNGPLTLDQLCEKLAHRGFSAEEYQVALADLIGRGWVTHDNGDFCLTELGVKVREAAEADTDDYFYRPWSYLSDQAIRDLERQLTRLKTALEMGRLM